jgi:hypothetical protein
VAATVFAGLVAPGAAAAVGIAGATGEIYPARDPGAPPDPVATPAGPAHDPGKPTAVVVLGPKGANVAERRASLSGWSSAIPMVRLSACASSA